MAGRVAFINTRMIKLGHPAVRPLKECTSPGMLTVIELKKL